MNIRGDELLAQYRSGVELWPIITDVEREFDLPPFLLWAEASRETNMQRAYAEGKVHLDGHGWGLFGADDRWNTLDLPHFASDPEEQARLAARTLRANFKRLGDWLDAVNAYGPAAGRPAYGEDVLERAGYLAAHPGGTPMETWHPRAHDASANKEGGSFIGVAPKIVLHTVEGSGRYSYNPSSYYGNPYWPHATIDGAGIHQHLPIDVNAFALANSAGGAETNRANAIQCEVLWFAGRIDELPDDTMAHLADWVGWAAAQTGAPLEFAEFRGDGSYGEDAPQRFTAREWLEFSGICGHQHVPENDHWDPGAFPVDRLRALLGPAPTPDPVPVPEEDEDDMPKLIGVTNNRGIFLVGTTPLGTKASKGRIPARYIPTPEEVTALVASKAATRDESAPDLPEALFNKLYVVVG